MTTPTVSIVLPTFNRLNYLRPAVQSILAQTMADWELIIADDGSDSETCSYLTSLETKGRSRIIWLPHTGNPSIARNHALRLAQGKYVAFLDSDDIWHERKLEIQLAAHAANPSCKWSYSALTRIDASGNEMAANQLRHWVPHEGAILEQLLTLDAVVATPSVIAERALIETAGGFDEKLLFFEEYDLWLRLIRLSEVAVINRPLVFVRSHGEHYTANRVGVYEARAQLLEKIADCATTDRLRFVLKMERAKNSTCLAAAHAAFGRLPKVMTALWNGRDCGWRSVGWWGKAGATLGRAAARRWFPSALHHGTQHSQHG